MQKVPVKNLILSSLAALLLASMQSSLFMTSFVICIAPIAIAALYAWAGAVPAGILSVGTVLSLASYADQLNQVLGTSINPVLMGAGALVVLVLPGIACIVTMEKKLPFFRRMAVSIAAQSGALLLLSGVMYLVLRVDMVDAITALMRSSLDYMPAEAVVSMLQTFGSMGMLTAESIEQLKTLLEQFSRVDTTSISLLGYTLAKEQLHMLAAITDQAFEYINYYMKQIMPAMILHSGVLTGIVMTSLSSRIAFNRSESMEEEEGEPAETGDEEVKDGEGRLEHVFLEQWQVPRRAMGMMLVGVLAGIALQMAQMDAALAVTSVFSLMLTSLLVIQGIAALSRLFMRAGTGKGIRIGMLIAALLFVMQFLEVAGAMSALFGSQGVVSRWMRKRMEESRKDDEE